MNSEILKVKCTGMDEEGKGIAKIHGQELHIAGLLEGETALVEVSRKRNLINAGLVRIEERAECRVKPRCMYFERCGGCRLQHMSYQGQAEFKQKNIERLLGEYHRVNEILPMKEPYFYRNKVHSTLAYDKNRNIISGIYEEKTHNVIPVKQCIIQDRRADEIIPSVRELMRSFRLEPYNEDTGRGFLRHILVKTGFASKQVMVVLVTSSQVFPGKNNFIKALLSRHPEITTVVMNVNNRKTSAVLGDEEKVLYGKGYIEDTLCGCVFQISPKSFYQINPVQTEVLYTKAIELAGLNGDETVLDAYCGIGTISLIVSGKVKKVIGVELSKAAVKDAIRNAKVNNIRNAYFYNDDAGSFMTGLARERQPIDTVFMDPPRSGSGERFLNSLVQLSPSKVVYISCNPVTQKRDIEILVRNGYRVEEIQPVDMFPQTVHVETCVLLSRKNPQTSP
ncbi:MAG TPA: 23S rRNA (uracil(1939)-C(5))-methyltransferase RlmD [Clostridia bacterium]|nr:23S rRNA (uracil(1939)-C(5))-methyltransferase RlmD [Clostridia bacterium]